MLKRRLRLWRPDSICAFELVVVFGGLVAWGFNELSPGGRGRLWGNSPLCLAFTFSSGKEAGREAAGQHRAAFTLKGPVQSLLSPSATNSIITPRIYTFRRSLVFV